MQTAQIPTNWLSWCEKDKRALLERLRHIAQEKAASHPHKVKQTVPDFPAWLRLVTPAYAWHWRHVVYICQQLDRLTRGEIRKLMFFLPPRSGKSELVTVRYAAWLLERNPEQRVIVGAYNQFLANIFSRKIRRIVETRVPMSRDRVAVEEWQTAVSGGLRAVGVGAGVTGQGGDLISIDDPVKSRAEAESETYRESVWQWYTDDLYTRQEPGAKMILVMTRWHHDDLAGRILESEDGPNWTVISLPAEAEENDPLGREIGEALNPERFDLEALAGIKTVLGPSSYLSLYQQRPTASGGNFLKAEWFPIVEAFPADAQLVRYWDLAATEESKGKDPDYTVGALIALRNGISYIADVRRDRTSPQGVELLVRQTAEMDGRNIPIVMEQEPGSAGKSNIDYYRRQVLLGWSFYEQRPTGDKVIRAQPFASQAEAGNVKMVRGEWNRAFLEEAIQFPFGKHDDQVDAISSGFNYLTTQQRGGSFRR